MSKSRKGFTLAELMVVMLIIAILIAVAVPVYLGSRNRAIVRAAQARLNSVVKTAKELRGGGNSESVDGNNSGIEYENMTAAQLNAEIDTVNVYPNQASADAATSCGSPDATTDCDVWISAQAADTISFETDDGDGNVHVATIESGGRVTIN